MQSSHIAFFFVLTYFQSHNLAFINKKKKQWVTESLFLYTSNLITIFLMKSFKLMVGYVEKVYFFSPIRACMNLFSTIFKKWSFSLCFNSSIDKTFAIPKSSQSHYLIFWICSYAEVKYFHVGWIFTIQYILYLF